MNKILKSLESKKVIKAVKSVSVSITLRCLLFPSDLFKPLDFQASRKKIYMLASLEPDRSITGGAWYNDQDFDMEFVEILNQQCFRFLEQQLESAKKAHSEPMAQRNASFVSSADVHSYITELRISNVSQAALLVLSLEFIHLANEWNAAVSGCSIVCISGSLNTITVLNHRLIQNVWIQIGPDPENNVNY